MVRVPHTLLIDLACDLDRLRGLLVHFDDALELLIVDVSEEQENSGSSSACERYSSPGPNVTVSTACEEVASAAGSEPRHDRQKM